MTEELRFHKFVIVGTIKKGDCWIKNAQKEIFAQADDNISAQKYIEAVAHVFVKGPFSLTYISSVASLPENAYFIS